MKIEYVNIIIALWFNLYVLFLFLKELKNLFIEYFQKKYIYWNKEHSIEHIEYITIYVLYMVALAIWLFGDWIVEWFNKYIVNWNAYIVFYIMWLANYSLLKHIKKERLSS
jgi:hypothetical protein